MTLPKESARKKINKEKINGESGWEVSNGQTCHEKRSDNLPCSQYL